MVTYYDQITPREYEPPGFTSALFDLSNLFGAETEKHHFGTTRSPFHCVTLSMEHRIELKEAACDRKTDSGQPSPAEEKPIDSLQIESPSKTERATSMITRCFCGCNVNDLDMIQCECCGAWQHTVCAGFYSNRDHRIQNINYICFLCRYKDNRATMKFVRDLAAYRRALSVVFNEGIGEPRILASRLGYSVRGTNKHLQKMTEEGFVERASGGGSCGLQAIKTKEVRNKLRKYFDYDLTTHPEFVAAETAGSLSQPKIRRPSAVAKMAKSGPEPEPEPAAAHNPHRVGNGASNRTSVTELTLSCTDAMEMNM